MVEEVDIKLYLKILSEKKWIVIFFMVLSVFLGLLVSFLTKPVYSASATLKIGKSFDPRSQEILDATLKSDDVLKETINALGLNYSVEEIRGKISSRYTNILVLTVFSEKPEKAAAVVNFLAKKTVILANKEGRVDSLTEEAKYLEDDIKAIDERMEEIEKDLKRIKAESATNALEGLIKISNVNNMKAEWANLENIKVTRQRELSKVKFSIQQERAEIKSLAPIPRSPVKPNLKFNVAFSLLLGLIIGAAVAILIGKI